MYIYIERYMYYVYILHTYKKNICGKDAGALINTIHISPAWSPCQIILLSVTRSLFTFITYFHVEIYNTYVHYINIYIYMYYMNVYLYNTYL